jgi:hypothetical protein
MAKVDAKITQETNDCVAKILSFLSSPGIENDRCRRIIETLHQRWVLDKEATIHQDELTSEIGLSLDGDHKMANTNAVRNSVSKLNNKKIPQFYGKYSDATIIIDIHEPFRNSGYRLRVRRKLYEHAEETEKLPIVFISRAQTKEWFRKTICESRDVLYVSIGSQQAIDQIHAWLQSGTIEAEHFRVLTWRPKSSESAFAFADHKGQKGPWFVGKLARAWQRWKDVEKEYPTKVEVYCYQSAPTMLGTCDSDRSLKVELIPFHRPNRKHGYHECGNVDSRPALLINAADHPQAFCFFKNAFEDLWIDSMHRALKKDIHPSWKEKRLTLLKARGLDVQSR